MLMKLHEEKKLTYMFITHDMGVMRNVSTKIAIMYLGKICEIAPTKTFYEEPLHPYTQGLMASIPTTKSEKKPLHTIPGTVPTVFDFKEGCRFADRCERCTEECRKKRPPLKKVGDDHLVQCFLPFEGEEIVHE